MTIAPSLKVEACRSCLAPVVWLRHRYSGKAAPIDAEPSPDGNILIEGRGQYSIVPKAARATFPGLLHTSHFATCAQAAQWKRKRETRSWPALSECMACDGTGVQDGERCRWCAGTGAREEEER